VTAVRRILSVEHEDCAGAGRLVEPLARALPGLVLDVVRPYRGEALPQDARSAGYHGLLVLGGTMSAWDDDAAPWLPATRALLRRAAATDLPTFGICLGAQLLALATGGRVERGGAGLEAGVCRVDLLPASTDDALLGPVLAACGARPRAVQWHQDAVVELPRGAVLLATGAAYPHQAFRLGQCAWGVQYHPEVSAANWDAWCTEGAADLRSAGRDPCADAAAVADADAELTALAQAHATAFAAVVGARSSLPGSTARADAVDAELP